MRTDFPWGACQWEHVIQGCNGLRDNGSPARLPEGVDAGNGHVRKRGQHRVEQIRGGQHGQDAAEAVSRDVEFGSGVRGQVVGDGGAQLSLRAR